MKIAIISRRMYCARVIEILSGTAKVEHTDSKPYGDMDLAVFIAEASEDEIIFIEQLIKSEFNSFDVVSLRFVTGRYPMLGS